MEEKAAVKETPFGIEASPAVTVNTFNHKLSLYPLYSTRVVKGLVARKATDEGRWGQARLPTAKVGVA